jgi:predicted pyridoxine 5'-phosphate oxidase superfamily flavin-nucleotide-binding protein
MGDTARRAGTPRRYDALVPEEAPMSALYHDAQRGLQDRFDTLEDRIIHAEFSDSDRDLIERLPMFFLATVDAAGHLNCSYKGGAPGFVRVVEPDTLAFPSYDGNGMFLSMGNVSQTGEVGMLFIDFEQQNRIRVNGHATIDFDDPLAETFPEAQFIVRVRAREIFVNCPRYIHRMQLVEQSAFAPDGQHETPVPDWKRSEGLRDALPAADRARDPELPSQPR